VDPGHAITLFKIKGPQRCHRRTILRHLNNINLQKYEPFSTIKEAFVEWKDTMDVKSSSRLQTPINNLYFQE